jgi:hypothetical protein
LALEAVLCDVSCPPHRGSYGRTTHDRAQFREGATTGSSSPGRELAGYQDVLSPGAQVKTRARLGGLEPPRSHESSLALWDRTAGYRSENSWLTMRVIPATITRSPPEYAHSASARGSAALGAGPKCYSPNRHDADLRIRIAILFEAISILLALTFMAICSPGVLQGLSCCRAKPPSVAINDKYFAPIICHCGTVVA